MQLHIRLSARWDTVFSDNLRPFTVPIYLLYCVCYHVNCKLSEIKITTTTTTTTTTTAAAAAAAATTATTTNVYCQFY